MRIRRGRPPHPDVLTPAEWKIVQAVRHGLSDRRIARLRGISRDAVKFHVANARAKLGLASRAALRHWIGAPAGSAHTVRRQRNEEADMVELTIGPIGQIARGVKDIARAESWYRDVLRLPHLYTFGPLAFFDCGGTRLMLQGPATAESVTLHNDSVLYFRVTDIHAAYEALRDRGAGFMGAPHMIHRHTDGTEEWMAFFRDSEDGVLALMSSGRP